MSSVAEYVGTFVPCSPEWHAARAEGLGGSEIAAVLGLSKWESRFSLWHRKLGRIPPQTENDEMTAGKRLEPAILQWWRDQHPEFIVDPTKTPGTYRSRERPWQIANPDLIATPIGAAAGSGDRVVEAKFAIYPDEWGKSGTDEIPVYYRCQVQWYMDVFGSEESRIAVFFGSCAEFREYVVRADPAEQGILRENGAEFMRSLADNKRPDIDEHSATYTALRQLPDGVDDDPVELLPSLADQYREALAGAVRAATVKRMACSLILDALGNHRKAVCLGEHIATRAVKPDGTTHSLPVGVCEDQEDAA